MTTYENNTRAPAAFEGQGRHVGGRRGPSPRRQGEERGGTVKTSKWAKLLVMLLAEVDAPNARHRLAAAGSVQEAPR